MIKYARVVNTKTGLCEVGLGTNEEYYLEIGMTKMKVDLSEIDNQYYVYSKCPHYSEEEKEEMERKRIANLTQTRANVWRALIQARMVTKQFVKDEIEKMPEETQEEKMAKEIARIDVDDVEDFHRGHELVNYIGGLLNITSENLDAFFETGDYHYLEVQESEEE